MSVNIYGKTRAQKKRAKKTAKNKFKGKRQVKRRVSGEFKARQKARARKIEVESYVVSPRGRLPDQYGITNPLDTPSPNMPLSPQDYFLLSRAIANMSWDNQKWILEIEFTSGHVYQFIGVSQAVWLSLKNAQSKGRAFHRLIYGYWTGKKGARVYHPKYAERRIR